ncbi:hypothetical protein C2I36_12925 [Rhodobacteraceae bacterium WD3A24]|nr:hypothetical protein C2I36_12925 [Rhodobacteraceae bacterium WD3A24]
MHAERRKAQHLNMIAQRSKAMPAKPRPLYHGERTRQVACRMDGELVPICTVFGQQEFMAICVRLNAINDALNAELGAGLGRPLDPSADSPQGRGGIPE